MKIDAIFEEWNVDSKVDRTELGEALLNLARLHQKYHQYLSNERMVLKKYESDLKELKLQKHEFYSQGPDEETEAKGWKLPARGIILKQDIPMYMDADKDIIELALKIGLQQEKVQLLDSIIRTIHSMSYNIRGAIDWQKFVSGN